MRRLTCWSRFAPEARTRPNRITMYTLRFFFDNLVGVCVWSGDKATYERFDYPIFLNTLPLSSETVDAGEALIQRWEQYVFLESAWPPDDSWTRFKDDCAAFVNRLRTELGNEFEINDEFSAH